MIFPQAPPRLRLGAEASCWQFEIGQGSPVSENPITKTPACLLRSSQVDSSCPILDTESTLSVAETLFTPHPQRGRSNTGNAGYLLKNRIAGKLESLVQPHYATRCESRVDGLDS